MRPQWVFHAPLFGVLCSTVLGLVAFNFLFPPSNAQHVVIRAVLPFFAIKAFAFYARWPPQRTNQLIFSLLFASFASAYTGWIQWLSPFILLPLWVIFFLFCRHVAQ